MDLHGFLGQAVALHYMIVLAVILLRNMHVGQNLVLEMYFLMMEALVKCSTDSSATDRTAPVSEKQ